MKRSLRLALALLTCLSTSAPAANIQTRTTASQGVLPGVGGLPVWAAPGGLRARQLGSLSAPSLLSTIPSLPAPQVRLDAAVAAPVLSPLPVLISAPQAESPSASRLLAAPQATTPDSQGAPVSLAEGLERSGSAIQAAEEKGGQGTGEVLDKLYEEGGRRRIEGSTPVAGQEGRAGSLLEKAVAGRTEDRSVPRALEAPATEKSSLEKFVDFAKSLFFPDGRPAGVVASRGTRSQTEGMATDEQMYKDMELSPLTYEERLAAVIELFKRGGAKPEEIITQDVGSGQKNVYVVKKGRTDRVIVVSSHHDREWSVGRGTIDNWTGTTMVTNLYQAMHDMETEATIVFMSFAREEDGLVGSARYLRSLSKEQRAKIDADVNLDTLAVDGTFSWQNNSTESLLALVKKVASQEKLDLQSARLWGGDADSSSFRRYGIAALTLFGVSPERIFDIVHSENDTMAVFSMPHYKNAFLLTLALLKFLNLTPVGPERFAEPTVAAVQAAGGAQARGAVAVLESGPFSARIGPLVTTAGGEADVIVAVSYRGQSYEDPLTLMAAVMANGDGAALLEFRSRLEKSVADYKRSAALAVV